MTHDDERNGTPTLFSASDVLTGSVIGQCLPRHRHGEFLKFVKVEIFVGQLTDKAIRCGIFHTSRI